MPLDTFHNLPEGKRSSITEVLLEEFGGTPYNEVSVNRIVHKAGISKGSFYQYFEDKKDCYMYLVHRALAEKTAFHRSLTVPGEMGLFPRLRWILEQSLEFQFSSPLLSRVLYRALKDQLPFQDEILQVVREGSRSYFSGEVTAAIARGELREDVDPDLAVFMLSTLFNELGDYMLQRFGITEEELAEQGGRVFAEDDTMQLLHDVVEILETGLKSTTGDH